MKTKIIILIATAIAVVCSAWLGFVAGQAHQNKPNLQSGFWIGIDYGGTSGRVTIETHVPFARSASLVTALVARTNYAK